MTPARDFGAVAKRYIEQVMAGEIPVGKLVRLAVERHVRDLQDGAARGLNFDEAAGARAIQFFGFLRHSKGEWGGEPFELSPWQAFILWVVFGWRRADGTRRFRIAYNEIPRKNGKSTFAAGIGLYLFTADGERGAEVYTAATKRDQARIVHAEAVRMVKASPTLRGRVGIFKDNLHVEKLASKFQPLGADGDTMDGLNVHGAVIDELHQHKTRAVWDALDTATGARRQPLIFAITTAGFNRHSICWQVREHAAKVLEGRENFADDAFFAFIATIDEGDDWNDEKNWFKANPNLGISVKLDDLRRKANMAAESPSFLNAFLTKHLNVWTEQAVKWLRMDRWDLPANAAPLVRDELAGRECYGGLDLATTTDIAALVLLFPPRTSDEPYILLPFFWVPAEGAKLRERRDRVPYAQWIKAGLIEATGGDVIDYDVIRKRANELKAIYNVKEIAADRWNATQIITQLQGDGFEIVPFGQGYQSMSAPTKEFEKLVISGRMAHGGNEVMRWMASNASVERDAAENLKPSKSKSTERIDGIVATVMALGRAIVNVPEVVWDGKIEVV